MLNENKNQKKRCNFDGHLVFLDELFLFSFYFALFLFMVLFLYLLFGEQLAEDYSWCTVCISNFVEVFEFKFFTFKFENILDGRLTLHISLGTQGLV